MIFQRLKRRKLKNWDKKGFKALYFSDAFLSSFKLVPVIAFTKKDLVKRIHTPNPIEGKLSGQIAAIVRGRVLGVLRAERYYV